ncbi:SDR family NAD(P)-dependent oxidoreductase [Archangium violaceum]|uniref:SDR family NAD(P)-dependent oxidoreductase n=1 Tax=Archangium violaceum TaxID=83451 RepID=UPI002B3242A2|nr:SDR family NAD(P)-dependent oxidoreductase [Archangium violaceum]
MRTARIRSSVMVRDTDPLVSEHRVQDIHILPGVSMLDAAYKVMAAAQIDTDSVVLRGILFHEPVVTNAEMDRKLTVTVEKAGEQGRISVTSVPWKGDRALSDSVTSHMTCTFQLTGRAELPPLPVDLASHLGEPVNLEACYGVTRHIGIFHDSFMKCMGTVAPLPSGDFVGTVSLGERALARGRDFLLHPVFLDCSTIVPLFHLRHRLDEANLFIPFAIDEFQARSLKGQRQVRVWVEKPDGDIADRELIHHSFGIYDMEGQPLVRFRKFGVKRVRALDGIRRLLARAGTVTVAEPQPVPVAPAPAPVAALEAIPDAPVQWEGEPLLGLIGSLIARHGKIDWSDESAETPFFDLGLDSLALLDISESLEKELDVQLYPTLLFERSTAAALAAYLRESFPEAVARRSGALFVSKAEKVPAETPATPAAEDRRPEERPQVLVPRWLPVRDVGPAGVGKTVALLGSGGAGGLMPRLVEWLGSRACFQALSEGSTDAVADFRSALEQGLTCDEIWLVGAGHDEAFALVKALLATGRLQSPLVLKALTFNAFRVHDEAPDRGAGHGMWGLLQSLSREYPAVRVSQVDLDRAEVERAVRGEDDGLLARVERVGAHTRELRAVRAGRLYERRLLGVQPSAAGGSVPLRQGGVYLVLGGAGGVGMEFVRHLRRHYGARVAVVGRRPEEELRHRLSAEGEYGRDILYVQASVEDEAALAEALRTVRTRWGGLNGIVHSAMVLDDRRLADMDADAFARVLGPKVAGAEVLARVTEGLELDFLLFFSSVQSFVGNASQGNYAAASTFLDGHAAALRARRSHPVVVINWGFWSEVGAVATDVYRGLLARQGVYGLRAGEALSALEQVLASGWEQAAIVAAEERVLEEMGLSRALVLGRAPVREIGGTAPVSVAPEHVESYRPIFTQTQQALEVLVSLARRRVARVLRELGLLGPEALSVDEAVKKGRIVAEHASLVRALLRRLEASGGSGAEELSEQAFDEAITRLAEEHAPLRHLVPLLRASLAAYPLILSGEQSAAEVVFPGGSSRLVRPVYGESEVSRFYNEAVAKAVRALATPQDRRPLRILEVGAGTGSTTVEILRELGEAGIACEYRYTDLWEKLVSEAKERLGPVHPSLRFSFLDIGTDPAAQGLREEFDVVVATNVLHATRDLHASLRHVKKLLRPGGTLLLNESVEVQEFSTYTFGLLPGWWSAVDSHERLPDSPLVSAAGWPSLLRDEGFVAVRPIVPADDSVPALGAQQIFMAWSDGEVRQAAGARPARPEVSSQRELPRALAGQLRPVDLAGVTRGELPSPRRLALYQDARDNLWLFLDNPPANTFTDELLGELCTTLRRLPELVPELFCNRLVFLSHFGEYFSLGGDRDEVVRRLAAGEQEALAAFADKARTLLQLLASMNALVVAVVNGTAQGGGLETLLATDFQLVRDGVKVGLPEIKSGLIPGMGGLSYLKQLVGLPRTRRLVMLGELLSAREAHELGLISHVVDDPFAAALALEEELQHVETALYMKQVLGRGTAERLTADIDAWLLYVLNHTGLIDARRVSSSRRVLEGLVSMRG